MYASALPDPYFNITSYFDSMQVFDVRQSKKSSIPAPEQPLQHGEATQLILKNVYTCMMILYQIIQRMFMVVNLVIYCQNIVHYKSF